MPSEELFLIQQFKKYYASAQIAEPPEIAQREFGIGEFGKKITQRHLSFSSQEEFNSFLRNSAPFFVSYSTALYKNPSARPMEAKGFFAGDIVYEFDADDIKTSCKQKHDSWKCPKCNSEGKGSIEACTKCGTPVKVSQWFCEECLGEAKKQVFELIDFLEKDFGITEQISINFSGSAGFHVHLRSSLIKQLKQEARIELLDYLTANNLDLERIGFNLEKAKSMLCPKPDFFGWGKRLAIALKELLETKNPEQIAGIAGMQHSKVKAFLESKQKILAQIEKGFLLPYPSKKSKEFWLALIKFVLEEKKLDIDRQTSVDLSKIIRVPETIHGGTGLIAKKIPFEELKKFNAFTDALAFESAETVKVLINKVPEFRLGKECFGPFENSEAELPLQTAVFLLAKQVARLV